MDYVANANSGSAIITANGRSSTRTIANAVTMQAVSSKADGGCPSSLTTGKVYQLKDTRDNEVYNVARLADGNCWLLDNLRLGSTTSTIKITSEDSNVAEDFTVPVGVTTSILADRDPYINASDKNNSNITKYGSGSGKVGVYYNFCAASAGTGCKSYNSSMPTNTSYSVCPKGWRMPTGGSSGEYQALYVAYSSNATNFRKALSTPLSGQAHFGIQGQNENGVFWSTTKTSGSTSTYALGVDPSSVNPIYGGDGQTNRVGLFSVRCLLQ